MNEIDEADIMGMISILNKEKTENKPKQTDSLISAFGG